MKPVLLTGATGFIGRRLQKAFLANDIPVVCAVRPGSVNRTNLQQGANCLLADLSDRSALLPALANASCVIYCAGTVRGRSLKDFAPANINGVRSLVDSINLLDDASPPVLLISSLAANRPGVSDYANSKYLGEQEIVKHARFPWTILRPPAVYGPGDREMLPILKLARMGLVTPTGPANQRLSLIHVDDLASAVLAWQKSWRGCVGQIYTLDDGHAGGYDWDEIAALVSGGNYRRINVPGWLLSGVGYLNLAISGLFGYDPMLTPGKARELTQTDWVCNNTAFSKATGWRPEITLEMGVNDLFAGT